MNGNCCFPSSDVEDGSKTVFPSAKAKRSLLFPFKLFAKKGISVKPKMGDALLFWNIKPDGSLDPKSLHGEITQSLVPAHDMFFIQQVSCHSTLTSVLNLISFYLGANPVVKGNKWSATKWMHVHEYKKDI